VDHLFNSFLTSLKRKTRQSFHILGVRKELKDDSNVFVENDQFCLKKSDILHKSSKITHTCFKINKNASKSYLFKVKNKQIKNSFIQKSL